MWLASRYPRDEPIRGALCRNTSTRTVVFLFRTSAFTLLAACAFAFASADAA
jgi:hypothetical protein